MRKILPIIAVFYSLTLFAGNYNSNGYAKMSGLQSRKAKPTTRVKSQQVKQISPQLNRGHEISKEPIPSAYSEPARIDVKGKYDFYIAPSFIYWQPLEQGLDLGYRDNATDYDASDTVIRMNQKFKPGFKINAGMSFDHDNWVMFLDYLWFHNTHSKSESIPDATNYSITSYWSSFLFNTLAIKAKWDLDFDKIDFAFRRAFYVGTNLVFDPMLGIRAMWIDQQFRLTESESLGSWFEDNRHAIAKSDSWFIGPVCGVNANWMFGSGFFFYGNAQGGLGYQDFKITYKEKDETSWGRYKQNSVWKKSQLTPFVETNLGLGWGAYCCAKRIHFDFRASYDFNFYINQNYLNDAASADMLFGSYKDSGGDLSMHGLTIRAKLDF
jgi:hypothetical protein